MFGSAIRPLQGYRAVGQCAADINNCTACGYEASSGLKRAVNQTPEVCLEQAPHILHRNIQQLSEYGYARIVNPSVEASEPLNSRIADTLCILLPRNIRNHPYGFSPYRGKLIGQLPQR